MSDPKLIKGFPPQTPLGIVHLLGWIHRCGDCVGRGSRFGLSGSWVMDWSTSTTLNTRGLLLYRRLHGDSRFPTHPGHCCWCLADWRFLVNAVAFGMAKGRVALWKSRFPGDPDVRWH